MLSTLWQPTLDKTLKMFTIESANELNEDQAHWHKPIDETGAEVYIKEHLEDYIRSLRFEVEHKMKDLIKQTLELEGFEKSFAAEDKYLKTF